MADTTCYVAGCERPAFRGGLCQGHKKRQQRGQPIGTELRERVQHKSKMARLMDSVAVMADTEATDDAGWRKVEDRVRKAAIAYTIELVKAAKGRPVHGLMFVAE